jgi:hypothetical protein
MRVGTIVKTAKESARQIFWENLAIYFAWTAQPARLNAPRVA